MVPTAAWCRSAFHVLTFITSLEILTVSCATLSTPAISTAPGNDVTTTLNDTTPQATVPLTETTTLSSSTTQSDTMSSNITEVFVDSSTQPINVTDVNVTVTAATATNETSVSNKTDGLMETTPVTPAVVQNVTLSNATDNNTTVNMKTVSDSVSTTSKSVNNGTEMTSSVSNTASNTVAISTNVTLETVPGDSGSVIETAAATLNTQAETSPVAADVVESVPNTTDVGLDQAAVKSAIVAEISAASGSVVEPAPVSSEVVVKPLSSTSGVGLETSVGRGDAIVKTASVPADVIMDTAPAPTNIVVEPAVSGVVMETDPAATDVIIETVPSVMRVGNAAVAAPNLVVETVPASTGTSSGSRIVETVPGNSAARSEVSFVPSSIGDVSKAGSGTGSSTSFAGASRTIARGAASVAMIDDPSFVQLECMKSNCTAPSLCYLPHPTNCFKFIMCRPLDSGTLLAQVMPCAFGTKWKSGIEPACDRYDLVDCPNDPCKDPSLRVYAHPDSNCRTYWRCVNGKSYPACCEKYQSFDPVSGTCVNDVICDDVCPLMNDATCAGGGVRYADFPDSNCRTHWDCVTGHPHPVCCPEGQGFNVFTSRCEPDTSCTHNCPSEYQDSCSKLGVTSYDLVDDNCRTYMKCNLQGQADPYCCLPGMEYDNSLRQCVDTASRECINQNCPYGFLEECRLEPVPNQPGFYKNLDAFGGTQMPCAVGTVFNPLKCQCEQDDNNLLLKAPPLECNMAIHVIPPSLRNQGTALAALLMIGDYGQGETGVGNMSAFWDGGDGLNIPYYGSQTLRKFFLEMRFQPTAATTVRQVILSSCEYINGVPTLEVNLDSFVNSGGTIRVLARNVAQTSMFETSAPFNIRDTILLQLIYDGTKIGMLVDYNDPSRPGVQAVQEFEGQIPIDRAGLRFAHCRYEKGISSFIGNMQEIKFSKCVPENTEGALNSLLSPR